MAGVTPPHVCWHIVLVTGSKPDGGVAESLTIWNCFWLCNQDQPASQPPGHKLAFKTAILGLGLYQGFTVSDPAPKLPQRHLCTWIDAKLLLGDGGGNVLLGHLADVTPLRN